MALVILSAALIPIMLWVPTSIQTKLQAERKATAIFLAQGLMEQLRYQILANFSTPRTVSSQAFGAPYQNFYYNVTDNLDANLKTISVQIWNTEKPSDDTVFYAQIAKR